MSRVDVLPSSTRFRGARLMAGAAAIYLVLRLAGFHNLFAHDADGVGALLQIIGTLYSVVYAFATYVIWGQFAAVENEILKEAGALKSLIIFSKGLKETARDPIVRAVRAYACGVTELEWGALSRGEDTDRTDKLFSGIISSVTEAKFEDESEQKVYERLLEITDQAGGHRDECLALSVKRIPRTLLLFCSPYGFHNSLSAFFLPLSQSSAGPGIDRHCHYAVVLRAFRPHRPG